MSKMGSVLPCGAHMLAGNTDKDEPRDMGLILQFSVGKGQSEAYRGKRRCFFSL